MARILAQVGLRPDGEVRSRADRAEFYLWPSCARFWVFWASIQTQWREGFSGRTGLDYAAVTARLDREFRRPKHRAEAWDHVVAMERAALEALAERRESSKGNSR